MSSTLGLFIFMEEDRSSMYRRTVPGVMGISSEFQLGVKRVFYLHMENRQWVTNRLLGKVVLKEILKETLTMRVFLMPLVQILNPMQRTTIMRRYLILKLKDGKTREYKQQRMTFVLIMGFRFHFQERGFGNLTYNYGVRQEEGSRGNGFYTSGDVSFFAASTPIETSTPLAAAFIPPRMSLSPTAASTPMGTSTPPAAASTPPATLTPFPQLPYSSLTPTSTPSSA
ncbi:hypothetical protein M9H77_30607 [Catharanthus roseus]|uniref:Uncharacterized protein n=1 Tax=Catharanthus roseus TaxID=4058 RepID=A0ACB9ZZK0_CATRO|nr:hypothetical protein M9H77_30607 [Catharanthus roseus]